VDSDAYLDLLHSKSRTPKRDRFCFDEIKDDLIQVGRYHGGDLVDVYHAELWNDNITAESYAIEVVQDIWKLWLQPLNRNKKAFSLSFQTHDVTRVSERTSWFLAELITSLFYQRRSIPSR